MCTCCPSASPRASDFATRPRPGGSVSLFAIKGWGLALVLGLAALLPLTADGQSSPPPLQATDLLNVQTIQDVALSPSGRSVAYTVRRAVSAPGETPEYRSQLFVTPTYGRTESRLLTRGGTDVSTPAWHPDGDQVAFVRPVDGTPQIFLLSLSGGEPYQLTDTPHGAVRPRWSPRGDRLLFSSAVPEPALRRLLDEPPPSARPGRSPQDTIRRVPPRSVLVLRSARTFNPVDTLALGPDNRLKAVNDTTRALRPPTGVTVPNDLGGLRVDSLRLLSRDSLRTVFDRLQILPDTTQIPVPPDTAATPDGDLLQLRRWLDQRPASQRQVVSPSPNDQAPVSSYRHYFLVDVPETATTDQPPRPKPRLITRGYRSFSGASWLPSGSQLVVSARPPDTTDMPRRQRALYVVDVAPYRLSRLLRIDGYALSNPKVTTDGTTLAFRAQPLTNPSYEHAEIGLFELDGRSDPKLITADFDHEIDTYQWSPDGWYLYVTAPVRDGRPLFRFAPFAQADTTVRRRGRTSLRDDYAASRDTFVLDSTMVQTAAYDRALPPSYAVQGVDVTDSKAVYAALTPENPSEIYANTVSFNSEKRLSRHNADWTRPRYFRSAEWMKVWHDGLPIHGRLTPPDRSLDTTRAPLAVLPRGGPPALDAGNAVSAWTERQYLSGQGYAVLEVWPRGSVGFGEAFRRHNFQDWGPGPAGDVLALADSVTTRSWVDPEAQVLAGRSYGGTLAAWLVGHTDRFDAAVAQGGVYDLEAFFGSSDAGELIADQFGGPPWRSTPPSRSPILRPSPLFAAGLLPPPDPSALAPAEALSASAPITRAHRIETPLLLLHGEADRRTDPVQADLLYRRLQRRSSPAEYVRYPGIGHAFEGATPMQDVDRLARLYEFFARYAPPPPSAR